MKRCCICGGNYEHEGNNPAPVKNEGRCCDKCNWEVVIPARIMSNHINHKRKEVDN